MTEIWNLWDLKPPPTCTVKMILHHKEMRNLTEVICDASSTLGNLACLDREAAILSRLLYKKKRIFRHDKAFQNLSKVSINQCLKRYLRLDVLDVVQSFQASLPKQIRAGASHAYLPTRQMLKWLLLRLLALSRLFARAIHLAKDTGVHLYKKLPLGWHVNLSLVVYSLTARILVASKFLVMKCIEWYDSLHACQPYLEETAPFVSDFAFPVNLKKWLGDVDVSPVKKKTSIDEVFELIHLARDEDDVKIVSENLFRYLRVETGEVSDVDEVEQVRANAVEDLGVPVRKEEEEEVKKKKKKKKNLKRRQAETIAKGNAKKLRKW